MHNFAFDTIPAARIMVFMIARSPIEIETGRRIKLAVWAYAYEFENESIVSDAVFDVESYMVDLRVDTNRPDLDYWFRGFFEPATGMWIHQHPERNKIKELYDRFYRNKTIREI